MAQDSKDKPESSVSRRAFLKGGAIATGALSSALIPGVSEAQLPDAVEPDPRQSTVSLKVNGVAYRKAVPNNTTLLQFLREDLKLTGTKMGCDRLQCGACTVIVNGKNVYSCTTLAVEATGGEVLTVEGLAAEDKLHPIQQAGQMMSTKVFLDKTANPTEDQARLALSGNLCRCAAYKKILESVMAASRLMRA